LPSTVIYVLKYFPQFRSTGKH